jgi:glutathione S-transferase
MAFVRTDVLALREQRSFWRCVYPNDPPPLTAIAEREASELVELTTGLLASGELGAWNIAHADLALTLYRLVRAGDPLPEEVRRFVEVTLARPAIRAYLDHPRPPNPPPRNLATG